MKTGRLSLIEWNKIIQNPTRQEKQAQTRAESQTKKLNSKSISIKPVNNRRNKKEDTGKEQVQEKSEKASQEATEIVLKENEQVNPSTPGHSLKRLETKITESTLISNVGQQKQQPRTSCFSSISEDSDR